MKLVNNTILSYMNFNICTTKFTTAIHTNKPTRQILLCSLLKTLIFKEIWLFQIFSAVYRPVTTLSGTYAIDIPHSWFPETFAVKEHVKTTRIQ